MAKDGKFVTKAGIVRSRLGRPGAAPHQLEQAKQMLAHGKGIINTAKVCGLGTSTVHNIKREMVVAAQLGEKTAPSKSRVIFHKRLCVPTAASIIRLTKDRTRPMGPVLRSTFVLVPYLLDMTHQLRKWCDVHSIE